LPGADAEVLGQVRGDFFNPRPITSRSRCIARPISRSRAWPTLTGIQRGCSARSSVAGVAQPRPEIV
jgi:hypothetical protein